MGYDYIQRDPQSFRINANKMADARDALQKYFASHEYVGVTKSDPFKMMEEIGPWRFRHDEDGGIVAASMYKSKGYGYEFMSVLSPFVETGSFLEIEGEDDDDIFRLVFTNGEVEMKGYSDSQ